MGLSSAFFKEVLGIQSHKLFVDFSFYVFLAGRPVYEGINYSNQVLKKKDFGFISYFPTQNDSNCGRNYWNNSAGIIGMARTIADFEYNIDFNFGNFIDNLRIAINYIH